MTNLSDGFTRLRNLANKGGVFSVVCHDRTQGPDLEPNKDRLVNAILMARSSDDPGAMVIPYDDSGKTTNRKILVFRWPVCEYAIELDQGHPVNKSIQRSIRRIAETCFGIKVKSPEKCKPKPHAALSGVPTTGESSRSPEVLTSSTGGYQAVR